MCFLGGGPEPSVTMTVLVFICQSECVCVFIRTVDNAPLDTETWISVWYVLFFQLE